ncbi:Histone-lysine N-methyltransferase, H3 lysine-79 specific [Frankliniella fusca]|uniref:Histone-lysine N-methyltransferase, H3 lysine-79 specific n=1 Tax=Frankliniella fusca TaxID=407009 RepID=A0AAE1HA80_9NEOP|nr:Histone-lysine N-methyltransferase, H3 lysine-79 specific [Frankliniella fusca]
MMIKKLGTASAEPRNGVVPKDWTCPWCVRENKIMNDILKILKDEGLYGVKEKNALLEKEKEQLLQESEILKTTLSASTEGGNILLTEKEETMKNFRHLKEENESLKSNVYLLQTQNADLLKEKEEIMKSFEHFKKEYDSLKAHNEDQENSVRILKDQIATLEGLVATYRKTKSRLSLPK